jgi:hypothetical protein
VTVVGDQIGYADRDAISVGHDYHYHDHSKTIINHDPDQTDEEGDDESSESGSGTGTTVAATSGFGGLIALFVVGYLIFGTDEPFPTQSDTFPAGVQSAAVTASVGGWLDKCQASASATPANCPQSTDETMGDASNVHWAFYGNPLEGAVVNYTADDKRFDVLGTVVVSADYTVSKKPQSVVTPMTYWAKVSWTDGKLEVQAIDAHSAIGDPDVTKQDPKQAWEPTAAKLKNAFTRCVRGAGSAMPAGCPDWTPPHGSEKVRWSMNGDPLLTARPSFDPKYGVVHVTGTYGLTVRYTWLGETKTESRTPNYEALIAPTATGPVVLQIKDKDAT